MMSLRTLALLSLFAVVPTVQTQAFLLDFSALPDGSVAANAALPGIADVSTVRSSLNEVGAFGEFGGGRGIELRSTTGTDSVLELTLANTATLVPSQNWVGYRFKVDITDGIASLAMIRENPGTGGDDFARILLLADGTMQADAGGKSPVPAGAYNADQWYHVAYDIDFAGGTSDVYVDGVLLSGAVSHDSIQPDAMSLAFFAFKGENRGAPKVTIDYIATGASLAEVTIPEPASLGLLTLSGLLILSRRSRRA